MIDTKVQKIQAHLRLGVLDELHAGDSHPIFKRAPHLNINPHGGLSYDSDKKINSVLPLVVVLYEGQKRDQRFGNLAC